MTTSLQDIGNEQLNDQVDFNNMPEQGGGFKPLLPPGDYRFKLPATLNGGHFKIITSDEHGARLQVAFGDSAPLEIVQSPKGEHTGEPHEARLTNVPRNRARKGQPAQYASDLDYLNKALGVPARPGSNRGYAETLINHATQTAYSVGDVTVETPKNEFGASQEWSWRCDPKRDAYFEAPDPENPEQTKLQPIPLLDESGSPKLDPNTQEVLHQQGCGERVYQNKATKVPSDPTDPNSPRVYPERITCAKCGANVRAFGNLTRFVE